MIAPHAEMLRHGGQTWKHANADPSAGVALWPGVLLCPRCGIEKGRVAHDRPGLCVDCRGSLTATERASWRSTPASK